MSAGRLQLYDKRAALRDRTSRLLLRLEGDRELRLREFGTKQRAWVKLAGDRRPSRTKRSLGSLGPRGLARPAAVRASCWPRRARCTRSCATST